jgi:hypothetical protein
LVAAAAATCDVRVFLRTAVVRLWDVLFLAVEYSRTAKGGLLVANLGLLKLRVRILAMAVVHLFLWFFVWLVSFSQINDLKYGLFSWPLIWHYSITGSWDTKNGGKKSNQQH